MGVSLACTAAVLASAQGARKVVDASMVLAADGARADSTVKAAAVARISPGFHINDHHPSLDYLIPTELKLDSSPNITIERLVYPKGKLKTFVFSPDTPLSVYEGTLDVGVLLKVVTATSPGDYTLKGKFSYQACNDKACLPPTSVPVELSVKVVGSRAPVKAANSEIFSRIKFD